jgi:hypothetical protein
MASGQCGHHWAPSHSVADIIKHWRTEHTRARALVEWNGDGGALWGPLSRGLQDCQYADCRTGGAQRLLAEIPADQIAWLLKLMWHRAAVAIAEHCLQLPSPRLLDPRCDQEAICDLANEMLSGIVAPAYGISAPAVPLDPSEYSVSHLLCFAMNAVTRREGPLYQLEDYYADKGRRADGATRPSLFPSRGRYLDALRCARVSDPRTPAH